MEFYNYNLLYLLLLVPVMAGIYMIRRSARVRELSQLGQLELVQRLISGTSTVRQHLKTILKLMVLLLLILSAARPQYGFKEELISAKGRDIFFAIDVSKSMLTQDIKPDRLAKARHEVKSMIRKLSGDRVGIIVFAGEAFVQCPLTLDYNAALQFIDSVDTGSVAVGGTNISAAIKEAERSFTDRHRSSQVVVILSDGEDHDAHAIETVRRAADNGIVVYTIGIGTPVGAPVPDIDKNGTRAGYKKDSSGQTIVSKINEEMLRELAVATEGGYYRATPAEFEIDRIYKELQDFEAKDLSSRMVRQKEDRFQYPLFLATLFLLTALLISDKKTGEQRL